MIVTPTNRLIASRSANEPPRRVRQVAFGVCFALASYAATSCTFAPDAVDDGAVFADVRQISIDGVPQLVRSNIASLGPVTAPDALELLIETDDAESVLILRRESESTALYIGGGPTNVKFDFLPTQAGEYFVFLPIGAEAGGSVAMTITATRNVAIPLLSATQQFVRVIFADDFLTNPGLFDPDDGTANDLAVLETLSDTVREEVLDLLRDIFADTPMVILGPDDAAPSVPVSTLTFSPERVLAEDQDVLDAALPPPDPARPQCQVRVIFGEVLPRGAGGDVGNRVPDDEAVVYVGSFQGRGRECWTAVINSVNNMVFALAQTAAHEIGHLVGLFHVEQIDLMNRTATLAFLRELEFLRGQVQVERTVNGTAATEVFTSVIQDPLIYFDAVFGTSAVE